jgi:hypothetical protein
MKSKLNLLVFALFLQACGAQKLHEVKITIVDEANVVIPEASITLTGSDTIIQRKTDLNGLLALKNIDPGKYKITVLATGHYKLKDYSVKINNTVEDLKIVMDPLLDVTDSNVEWSGGWATIEEKMAT